MQMYPLVRRAGGVVDATFHGLDGKEEVPNYKCTKSSHTQCFTVFLMQRSITIMKRFNEKWSFLQVTPDAVVSKQLNCNLSTFIKFKGSVLFLQLMTLRCVQTAPI